MRSGDSNLQTTAKPSLQNFLCGGKQRNRLRVGGGGGNLSSWENLLVKQQQGDVYLLLKSICEGGISEAGEQEPEKERLNRGQTRGGGLGLW